MANKLGCDSREDQAAGGQIDPDLVKDRSDTSRYDVEWHYIFGYALAALFILRIFVAIRHPETRPNFKALDLHHKLVTGGYIALTLMTLMMIGSGFGMYFSETLGLAKSTVDFMKENHETAMWFFVAFTALHIGGVFIAENRDEPGIVSRMINGRKAD
ncbi:MAG: cytochrome b/b6 domain-containing protein [Bdellovibrionales bacterium]|nr:cytochrome b/b6 domain-containing protein [Bdellovibrionales bacterium]